MSQPGMHTGETRLRRMRASWEWLGYRWPRAAFADRVGRQATTAERPNLVLFPSHIRNPHGTRAISYGWFNTSFRNWIEQLDLGGHVPHQARHTVATNLLRHGAGLHHIKKYLGHVSTHMAEHYANSQKLHQTGEKLQVAC